MLLIEKLRAQHEAGELIKKGPSAWSQPVANPISALKQK
jgi:hypothetical protein